jgi:VanZ family protein
MSSFTDSDVQRFAAVAAVVLTTALFVIGGRPEAGQVFKGPWHFIAHFGTYAVIAVAYLMAWPRLNFLACAALVAAIGAIHEAYEIEAHGHGFEVADAIVNGAGALFGAFLARWQLRKRLQRKRS